VAGLHLTDPPHDACGASLCLCGDTWRTSSLSRAKEKKDGHWTLPSLLGYLVAQMRANGSMASAVQAALVGLDPTAVE
jgi:hypothetical protein